MVTIFRSLNLISKNFHSIFRRLAISWFISIGYVNTANRTQILFKTAHSAHLLSTCCVWLSSMYMYLWNQQTKWFNLIKHLNTIHKYLYGLAIIGPFHGMNKCVRRWWLLRKFNFCEQIFIIKSSSKQFNFNNVERKKKNLHFLFCRFFFQREKKGHKINKGMFREIREAIRQNTKI